jgi:hypothetical protein
MWSLVPPSEGRTQLHGTVFDNKILGEYSEIKKMEWRKIWTVTAMN